MRLTVLLLLLVACKPVADSAEPGTGMPPGCDGPALIEPVDAGVYDFAFPTIRWREQDGASSYTVVLSSGGVEEERAEGLTETHWTPSTAEPGAHFEVTVTEASGQASCSASFTVRTFGAEPIVTSPGPICGDEGGMGSGIAYAATWANGDIYSTGNKDGLGLCRYDGDTLAFAEHFGSQGETFRSFGVTTDPDSGALLATVFPMTGQCGDNLERLLIVDDPGGARTVSAVNTGMESGVAVVARGGRAYLSALAGMSCLDEDTFCLDWGETCTHGYAELVAWDLEQQQRLYYTETMASPGLAVDEHQLFRAGVDASIAVHDLDTGALRLTIEQPASPRGLIRHDDPAGRRFLVVTDFDMGLRGYRLPDEAISDASDLVEVLALTTTDRYWQGAVDGLGRFVFPAQEAASLVRHDLLP